MRSRRSIVVAFAALAAVTGAAHAQSRARFDEQLLKAFVYRNLGPFRVGARTSDLAVPASPARDHLYTYYLGFWNGGLWKTTDNGITFRPVFDGQAKLSIGDVTVAPSDPDIVWVGTGDAFTSRSSYAGASWEKVLYIDERIGVIDLVLNPQDPDVLSRPRTTRSGGPGTT